MPVTTKPASHDAKSWPASQPAFDEVNLLISSCKSETDEYFDGAIVASSLDIGEEDEVYSFENGFVQGAVRAYSMHHHLVIRPEDVWFSILTQLSFYINAHSEELRGKFVAHEGQVELEVISMAIFATTDYGKLSYDTGKLMQQKFADPVLREWFLPAFTTTSKTDQVVASVIMIGAMLDYFKYKFTIRCGLPSVTLLGEQSDWEKILARLEKLPTFGTEPGLWYTLLKPVITRFVETFKSPDSNTTRYFWQQIAHHSEGGSGPSYLSGWITAFCFWSDKGQLLHALERNPPQSSSIMHRGPGEDTSVLVLDSIKYNRIEMEDVPSGWCGVPVTVDYNGVLHYTRMVAGSVGVQVTSKEENGELNTVQPVSGWWIYEKKAEPEKENEDKSEL